MPRRARLRLWLYAALILPWLSGDATALLLYAEGEVGNFGTIEQMVGPSATGPISLPATEINEGGRHAAVTAEVDAGIVRISATASASVGAQSVGNWDAVVKGSWEDSITFDAPTTIPELPGVDIMPGLTVGHAQLVMDVTGSFITTASNAIARANYGASLGYGKLAPFAGRCCGPKWLEFGGEVNKSGEQNGAVPPASAFDGDSLPNSLLLDVTFVFGEAFDVSFELSTRAEVGWEGVTSEDLLASALLDQSALWQGPRNVTVEVDDGLGGTMNVAMPDGSWAFTSDDIDYSMPVSVPEPTSALMLGIALSGIAWRARRRL